MEIFQHQHQRILGRDRLQRFAYFPQHTLARGTQDLPLEGLSLLAFHERRELHQPCGCTLCEYLHQSTSFRTAHKFAESGEHGVVGFLSSKTLDALAASESQFRNANSSTVEFIHKRGFPDPSLTCHEDDLSPTTKCAIEEPFE